ncbi:MAG: ATP-binding protein [Pseudomonadota bacterium]
MTQSSNTPIVHLLCGRIGSGKTSFAKRLERETGAVRFTHDEWVHRAYGSCPPETDYADIAARINTEIWNAAIERAASGQDSILDYGFWTRDSRDLARERVARAGAVTQCYYVRCPVSVAQTRTLERSEAPPSDSLWIDAAAFQKLNALFEPPHDDEEFVVINGAETQFV